MRVCSSYETNCNGAVLVIINFLSLSLSLDGLLTKFVSRRCCDGGTPTAAFTSSSEYTAKDERRHRASRCIGITYIF